jgi:uncharacterized protein YoxC
MSGIAVENRLLKEKRILEDLKGKVSGIYADMGGFIVKSTDHMNDFRKMIAPYVNYFFPADTDMSGECFINDVVAPSKNELDGAIDRAAAIMAGDEKMNENVSRAIQDILGLKKSVDMILGLIDEIDIYSENMLIISTKYGDEGKALARISNEMGAMAGQVNGIGVKFRGYLQKLDTARNDFNSVRGKIDAISENYLTRMKLNLSIEFGEMTNQLNGISKQVHGMFFSADEIESSMKSLINNIQMEDVIRQKIDKILFYLDKIEDEPGKDGPSPVEDFGPIILHVVSERFTDLLGDVSSQHDEVHGCFRRLSKLLNAVDLRLNKKSEIEDERQRNRMDEIYNRIENLKNEYIGYMEEIIANKKNLLGLCASIIDVLHEFENLFKSISDVVQRFEAVNMITRIELARHTRLSRKLGGALTSVMSLPVKMKRIVEISSGLYRGILKNMVDSVTQYSENFKLQEKVLADCIGSMKKVSVKLYESQKYYWDISQENGRYCRKVLAFIDEHRKNIGLFEVMESIRDIMASINAYAESEYGDYQLDVESMRRLRHAAGGDSLAAELSREFGAERTKEHVIIF